MITWIGRFRAFYDYACAVHDGPASRPNIANVQRATRQFATHFNCEVTFSGSHIEFKCAEEDLLMVKLQCPEAVECVL